MAFKRALVVDDSKAARVALKKLLEQYEIDVDLATCGEEALEYLAKRQKDGQRKVDAIFMDHTMPGMDGLEAVSAIKSDPNTATIPVMMYTTKEGEVYVGQARALGAVGVLPKNVAPGQLFEMLQSLGLVQDRRGGSVSVEVVEAEADTAAVPERAATGIEGQALGMSLRSVVTRILEDQHMVLRSDILRTNREFARDVAVQVLNEQAAANEQTNRSNRMRSVVSGVLVAALVIALLFVVQLVRERDLLLEQVGALEVQAVQGEQQGVQLDEMSSEIAYTREDALTMRQASLDMLVWTLNEVGQHEALEEPFGDELAERIDVLMNRLLDVGFVGDVVLTSRIGRYCLRLDEQGTYQIDNTALQAAQCDLLDHPRFRADYVSDRLSVEFVQMMRRWEDSPINLQLVALDTLDSAADDGYPSESVDAATWNAIASENNRVTVAIEG